MPVSREDMVNTIEKYLKTITGRGISTVEIAFYGGSFTGIPFEQQQEYLAVAKSYKDRGLIHKIHLSTRPDYINEEILTNLKQYGADIIELGVQSFDEEVLRLSGRGHSRESVYEASRLIMDFGFELGLQLMIGLPGDTYEKAIQSAKEAVKIGPAIARLYPTVIIRDTELYNMYLRGDYTPFSPEETIQATKEMYRILTDAGINVIRVGLKSTDLINENAEVAGGYHPAFRQLIESEIAKEQMEARLEELRVLHPEMFADNTEGFSGNTEILFFSNGVSFSNMIGNRKTNRIYFEKKYPHVRFTFHVDENLPNHIYVLKAGNDVISD